MVLKKLYITDFFVLPVSLDFLTPKNKENGFVLGRLQIHLTEK